MQSQPAFRGKSMILSLICQHLDIRTLFRTIRNVHREWQEIVMSKTTLSWQTIRLDTSDLQWLVRWRKYSLRLSSCQRRCPCGKHQSKKLLRFSPSTLPVFSANHLSCDLTEPAQLSINNSKFDDAYRQKTQS